MLVRFAAGRAALQCILSLAFLLTSPCVGGEPVPEKLVVLTFDDSVKSHFTVVRPILLQYGFGATFFITEGFDFKENKRDYMTWNEIAQLHRDGFEIGNHTRDHKAVAAATLLQLDEQVEAIADRCRQHEIPVPMSFAYPGNGWDLAALPILQRHGIRFARRGVQPEREYDAGHGFAYEPHLDHPLLIPTTGDARPDWELADFQQAVQKARHGRIAILQFHGVPDRQHPWVHTPPDRFEAFMKYLSLEGYRVVALRDLQEYVDPDVAPQNPSEVINDRQRAIADGTRRDNFRTPATDAELRDWLENMAVFHRFTVLEMSAATGLPTAAIEAALQRFDLDNTSDSPQRDDRPLVLPYPGGRHPRIGFRDGAIRPQRETKFSAFLPWTRHDYVVVDVPEAIWMDQSDGRELLYLAHTHVPTRWSRQGVKLDPLEWKKNPDGALEISRTLPNQVTFGARVVAADESVRMKLWLTNHGNQTLTGLRVQNCVMLGRAAGFQQLDNQNKRFAAPYVACHDTSGNRWIITAWEACARTWGNAHCPCVHSDPQFPDCPPGETRELNGWLSFYEGRDIDRELQRIEQTNWREAD